MEMTAEQISALVDGEIVGDPSATVNAPSKIEDAKEGCITFLGNSKYEPHIYTSLASIVLVPKSFSLLQDVHPTLIKVENVYTALGQILKQFETLNGPDKGISQLAYISDNVSIPKNIAIGPFAVLNDGVEVGDGSVIFGQVYLGHNVKVGSNTIIYPGVKIYPDSIIGSNCIIHANAVIGSDGFGFSRKGDGSYTKIPQIGKVIIEDNVEIGACTVIDRATMDDTIVRQGVKLDNLIQVAHNVVIGENTVIAAQSGISGSTEIGEDCMIGGQVGFTGHIKVADSTMVQAQSGVAGNVNQEGSKLYGSPAIDYQQYLKAFAYFKKLPEIVHSIRELEKRVDHLSNDFKI